jgi:Rap1a immunity proteins
VGENRLGGARIVGAYGVAGESDLIRFWLGVIAAIALATQAQAQSDPNSGMVFYPSCLAASDIVQGKRPAADSEDASKQLRQAAICFGAVTTIMNVERFFKPEFAICPPKDTKISVDQMIPVITAYLKNHPERMRENFHQLAVTALAATWPCSQ